VPSWPDITQLPRWSQYVSKLKLEVSGVSADLPFRLASNGRTMSSSDCDLVAGLLQWEPSSRFTDDQAVSHSVWRLVFSTYEDKLQQIISAHEESETTQLKGVSISAAPCEDMPPSLTTQCACSANCGSAACWRAKSKNERTEAKNRRHRSHCHTPPLAGFTLCFWCKCESDSCDKGRVSPTGGAGPMHLRSASCEVTSA
jgi:hypothetical protein